MSLRRPNIVVVISAMLGVVLLFGVSGWVFAQQAPPAKEVNDINQKIEEKKASIDHIKRKIEEYRQEIKRKEKETASLKDEVDLLENRKKKTELDIRATKEELEAVQSEIDLLDRKLGKMEAKLEANKESLKDILREVNVYDSVLPLEVVFGTDSFSELFDQLQYLEDVNGDLKNTLKGVKQAQLEVKKTRTSYQGKQSRLAELKAALIEDKTDLEEQVGAKKSLVAQTQESEAQYRSLLTELRQEQAFINYQINRLQNKVEKKLEAHDQLGETKLLSWPVDPGYRGLSTYFHDPTYPFRHLFEHSGIDIPQAQGTPVKAAAPGYVAWTRTGRLYGNYIMIIHTNGKATLYAHMSQISVAPDDFVARGDTIGLSGGLPGTPGAGLSTGPHLHFEVRQDGIPVNPMNYLVQTDF